MEARERHMPVQRADDDDDDDDDSYLRPLGPPEGYEDVLS